MGVKQIQPEKASAERALIESEEKYRSIFETAANLITSVNTEGIIVDCNRRINEFLGYTRRDIIGQSMAKIIHPDDLSKAEQSLGEILSKGYSFNKEYRMVRKDGAVRNVSINSSGLTDSEGNYIRTICIIDDITDRTQALEALQKSESNLREAQRLAQMGSWEWDLRTDLVAVSEEMKRIWWLTTDRPDLSEVMERVHPDDAKFVGDALQRAIEQDSTYDAVFRIVRGDAVRVIHGLGHVGKEGGKPVSVLGTGEDITEKKRVEDELRYHASLLESVSDAVVSTDEKFIVRSWNKSAERIYGWKEEEARGKPAFDLMRPLYLNESRDEVVHQLLHEGKWRGEIVNHHRDGTPIQMMASAVLLRNEQGAPTGAVAENRDISEQKKIEAQLMQSERLASVGLLAAGVAHEINNPLTYVLQKIERLSEDLRGWDRALAEVRSQVESHADSASFRQVARILDDAFAGLQVGEMVEQAKTTFDGVCRVRDIVKDLNTFSRIDQDQISEVNVNDVVDTAINMARNEIKYRARLVRDYTDLPPIWVNDGKLAQVFLNLLINAAHAIEEGDMEHNHIRVRTQRMSDQIAVEINDTGAGIQAENIPRLFDPFFTTKDVGAGSGLGLSICSNIVSQYNGKIDVESVEGEGSRFTVWLPCNRGAPTSRAKPEPPADTPASRGRFLVVDDEPIVAEVIETILKRDHDVIVVESGEAAKAQISENHHFDGIICDLMMPGMTGMDLHAWVEKKHSALAERMIFMSGGTFTTKAKEFMTRVDNLKIQKPFESGELRALVNRFVRSGG